MFGSGAGNSYGPIGGLNGGLPRKSPPGELPPSEFPNCLPFGGW